MKQITFGSVCSGIEAASVAWLPLGFRALWYSEIESYPCRVLAQRFPETPNLGDITRPEFTGWVAEFGRPRIIVGGTPCQAFSVAGLRKGLADDRGNLTLRYVEICDAIGPDVCVWENVPGVLSSEDNAFGCFLGALAGADWPFEPGPRPDLGKSSRLWRWNRTQGRHIPRWSGAGFCGGPRRRAAWRILDAQYFGVPQRRRRVFVVACTRASGVDPAEILFERESLHGNPAPGGPAWTPVARAVTASTGGASAKEQQLTFVGADGSPLNALETAHALPARHDGSEDGTGRGIPLVTSAVTAKWAKGTGGPSGDECQNLLSWPKRIAPSLTARFFNDQGIDNQHVNGGCGLYVPDALPDVLAFDCKNDPAPGALSPPLRAMGHLESHPNGGGQVAVAAPILEPGSRTGVSTDDIRCGDGIGAPGDPMFTLQAGRQHGVMVHWAQGGGDVEDGTAGALRAEGEHSYQFLRQEMGVRRLTPRECERLQGFPDDFTLVDWPDAHRPKDYEDMTAYLIASGWPEAIARGLAKTPDGHRYKALGNSMATPVMQWLGMRIGKALS
ncbi:MAG TPA: DNA cytosine methyltransferase [Candidatus Hydrogenedentes bacterium]|nr:DNA cytosine methyltransferase [Candidatus Hydrogenedentota bacterium]HRT64729.1 DNA cytosine methyltransferase [Candidatus Hydrogenedentota bacterium]